MTALGVTGRIDRAMERMRSEGFKPRLITLGRLERQQMADHLLATFPSLPADPSDEQLADVKYQGVPVEWTDEPFRLRVEGIWVDPVLEAEDLVP